MSGINHLYDIYNKKGANFINDLFNQFVTINEKMDGSAFTFERDRESGRFKFYRRDQRNPITLVDRTLMRYYEKPINYIESLPPHVIEKIPRGWRFGLEYFANNKPVEIVYDRTPKNHLILSYVHQLDESRKIIKTIQDKDLLDTWADLLGVERPPIIFQGILDSTQKIKLMEFLETPFKDLVEKFRTNSFVRFIISTLNPELSKTALNEDLDKDVEGIVFRFGDPDKEGETVLAKMVDPIFTEIAKSKYQEKAQKKPSDFLGITLMDVMNFILEEGVRSFDIDGDTEDERYISFISDVFVRFLDRYENKYKNADYEEPEYLKKEEFRLNKDLINDRRVLKYLEKDQTFESLYKLILNSFRKIKTRAGGIINKGMQEQFNSLVEEIRRYVEKPKKEINESSLISFDQFKKEFIKPVEYLKEEDEEDEKNENPLFSYDEFIGNLETIDSQSSKFDSIVEDTEEERKKINVILGRFQPFHYGHLKMADFLKEKNGFDSYIIVVHPGHNKSGKSPFPIDKVERYMGEITKNHPQIEGFMMLSRGLLGSAVAKLLDSGYDPQLIGAGDDRIDDYQKQMEYIKQSDIKDIISPDLKLIETPRSGSATKVREALTDRDFSKFKKMVPPEVAILYNDLVKDV
jgi:cytidyltransferase-like protein